MTWALRAAPGFAPWPGLDEWWAGDRHSPGLPVAVCPSAPADRHATARERV